MMLFIFIIKTSKVLFYVGMLIKQYFSEQLSTSNKTPEWLMQIHDFAKIVIQLSRLLKST
jgi:hypothetical protein